MTTQNELLTAEQAREHIRSLSLLPEIDKPQIVRIAESALRTLIALHEALVAANAKIAELEAGASRSLFALMTDRALAAEARADAAEARVAVRVKPLVWGLPLGGFYTAHLPFYGKIEIMRDEVRGVEAFILYRATPHRRHYPTLEAAQAAAQADYEARITAALETGERTPVAWMGREGYFTTDPRQDSAHAHHGTPLTPLYASAALETGAGDE